MSDVGVEHAHNDRPRMISIGRFADIAQFLFSALYSNRPELKKISCTSGQFRMKLTISGFWSLWIGLSKNFSRDCRDRERVRRQ